MSGDAMGRIWLLAVLLYGYGDPGFDGHRPASLDRPLREFHRTIDATAANARRALVAVDDNVRSIRDFGDRLHKLSDVLDGPA